MFPVSRCQEKPSLYQFREAGAPSGYEPGYMTDHGIIAVPDNQLCGPWLRLEQGGRMYASCPVSQGGKKIQREGSCLKEKEDEEGAAMINSNPQICSSVIGPYLVCCLYQTLVSNEIFFTNYAFIVVTTILPLLYPSYASLYHIPTRVKSLIPYFKIILNNFMLL